MSKNLTGSKRIIYDSCVVLYNVIQKWRSVTNESHSIILNIWNVKQEVNETDVIKEKQLVPEFPSETFKVLDNLISSLINKVQTLGVLLEKMKNAVTKIKAVSELSDLHQSNMSDVSAVMDYIPFKTWSLSKLSDTAEEIATIFENDFKNKSNICKEICHISDKSSFLFFEVCWKYEASIDKYKLDMLLNGILFELDLILEIN